MSNRYEPVKSLRAFSDIFAAAYDSGNRFYIASMVLASGLVNPDAKAISLGSLMPSLFIRGRKSRACQQSLS